MTDVTRGSTSVSGYRVPAAIGTATSDNSSPAINRLLPRFLRRRRAEHETRVNMLRAWAAHDVAIYRNFVRTVAGLGGGSLEGKRVLDLGCGANAPVTLMLHSAGVNVTGVDSYIGYRWGLGFRLSRYVRFIREAGLFRAFRKLLGELVYDRVYYQHLQEAAGMRLSEKALDLRVMRVEHLQVADASVDVIHSNATWEHVADVDAANRELARVLKPGGLAYIEIHLFPSLSGGHDLPWIVPGRIVLDGIEPWGHLRNPHWKPPVFLNRCRERDYRRSFERTAGLEIVEWNTEFTEGESLLGAEILRALPDYSSSELTTRSIIVVVRKRAA